MRTIGFSIVLSVLLFAACDANRTANDENRGPSPIRNDSSEPCRDERRFVFAENSQKFEPSSIALDTQSGQLCRTFDWKTSAGEEPGIPLCGNLAAPPAVTVPDSLIGATKAYLGYSYIFDGEKWKRKSEAKKYNPRTRNLEPLSEDQYDPLGLFTPEEKSHRLLKSTQIGAIARQFGVKYEEALADAKKQGYKVEARPPIESFER